MITRTTAVLATSVLIIIIISFVVLLALGRDVEQLSDIVVTTIVPTIVLLFVSNKVDKVAHNTNGRMSELMKTNRELAAFIRAKFPDEELTPEVRAQIKNEQKARRLLRGERT